MVAADLMWATRIIEAVRRAGASAVPLASESELEVALEAYRLGDVESMRGAVVDLAVHRLDGVGAIERLSAARLPVIAVAEHDDQLTRKRALDAGALRVFSYRKFFEDGTRLLGSWLASDTTEGE
mgnify:CR=1 FL=1